jgi:hypothetical protein
MANAIPVSSPTRKEAPEVAKKSGPEIVGKLPEGFEVPEKAKRVVADERGTVRVDF